MDQNIQTTLSGDVTDIFAHRFVVRTTAGTVLADLGPGGAEMVKLRRGDHVDLWGEMKPSELKVSRIARTGEEAISIPHGKPTDHQQDDVDPEAAVRSVEANGFAVVGVPRRKPRHFEILGRDKGGDLVELHVELDGTLRKSKPVLANEPKWFHATK